MYCKLCQFPTESAPLMTQTDLFFYTAQLGRKGTARGIPNILMDRDNRARQIPATLLPDPQQAVQMYRDSGGSLTDPASYGDDPLAENDNKKQIRERCFGERFSLETVFHKLVNGDSSPFREAILFYIDVTRRLSSS